VGHRRAALRGLAARPRALETDVAREQPRQLAHEAGAIEVVDPAQHEAVREALGRLHDQVRRQVRIGERRRGASQRGRERVRERFFEAQHAGVRGRRVIGLVEQDPVQRRPPRVQLDHRLDERVQLTGELGRRCRGRQQGEQARALALELALDQRDDHRILVRKILVQRADRDARELGHVIGGAGFEAARLENPSRGVEDGGDRRLRTALRRLAARACA